MSKVIVTGDALRSLVREVMFNKEFAGWSSNEEGPAAVNPNVDPSAAVTDPVNPNFTPQTKTEFGIAVNQLVKDLPDTQMPKLFDTVKTAIDQKEETKEERDEEMEKKTAAGGTGIEEAVRNVVRKTLADINPRWDVSKTLAEAKPPKVFGPVVGDRPPVKKIPAGEHGAEYMRKREKYQGDLKKLLKQPLEPEAAPEEPGEEPGEEHKRHAYKATALGGMSDVGGASFEDIAKELDFSVAGAKQAVDKALEKAKFLASMDQDDKEILVLTTMNDYIKYLTKSGELTGADVQLLKDHPDIVRELDGFREFLHNAIRRQRKQGQEIEDPMGESEEPHLTEDDTEIKGSSIARSKETPKPGEAPHSTPRPLRNTKAKSMVAGGDVEVDWGGMDEAGRPMLGMSKGMSATARAADVEQSDSEHITKKQRLGKLKKMIGDKRIKELGYAPGTAAPTHAKVDGESGTYVWNPQEHDWELIPSLRK